MPRKIRCAVESITDHGGRVYTVDLVPQSAVPGFRPVRPNKPLNIALGCLGGLVLGAAAGASRARLLSVKMS